MLKSEFLKHYNNFKCAEIYCMSPPAVFNVTCILCDQQLDLDQFVVHFQSWHLTLVEESIRLQDLVGAQEQPLVKDCLLTDELVIKEEIDSDPIKHEDLSNNYPSVETLENRFSKEISYDEMAEENEDDECLQQLVNENKKRESNKAVESCDVNFQSTVNSIEDIGLLGAEDTNGSDESCSDEDEWSDESKHHKNSNNSSKELPFKCSLCPRSYMTKHALQKHHYSAHNPKKRDRKTPKPVHKCDICNEIFRSAIVLGAHRFKHTGIFCDICGKPFKQVGTMVRHKIRHTGIKEFKCQECPKEFFTAKELKSHMYCHIGMQIVCEICGKKCRDRGVLTAHMRRHTGERPAKCEVCGKSFFSIYDLNVHAVAHTNDRPFPCDICGSRFQRKKALRIHKRIHSKDRSNHVCKICGKSFAQSSGLNSHMRTHETTMHRSDVKTMTSTLMAPPEFIGNSLNSLDNEGAAETSTNCPITEISLSNVEQQKLLNEYDL
ncbi:zinc finger protein 62 [Stomoxys calcitrans]|uniref:C2H2-type domain-containing protein n=1 Tax=Stomoxys calcitrans TaxID=35570 RepID=A0A1I8NRR1_STOCA|nr:zinc finger protein 62 [Stomoxys calcitrans]